MGNAITPQFIANWKMNMRSEEAQSFLEQFAATFTQLDSGESDAGIAPTFTSLPFISKAVGNLAGVRLGAQNVHWLEDGAHTGEISAPMLQEYGVEFAIVGHSERRQFYGETDAAVAMRARAAITHGMQAIVCIGESEADFKAERTDDVVLGQLRGSLAGVEASELDKLLIAYEPVWAIGTGLAATPEIAARVHGVIRQELVQVFGPAGENIAILYGGSTKPENIFDLCSQEHVNGALVGGASLKPDVFAELITNGRKAA